MEWPTTDRQSKLLALEASRALNPRPESVTEYGFVHEDFLDPHDLVQVRYEMLRAVYVEAMTTADASALFGVTRPTFYAARRAMAASGLVGLRPRRPGPRRRT